MKKGNIFILVVVLCVVGGLLFFKQQVQITGEKVAVTDSEISLKQEYEEINKQGKPSVIIFSYDADCCESTKLFFEEYNNKIKAVMDTYDGKLAFLFINIGILDEKNHKEMVAIAQETGAEQLPTLVLRDAKGTVVEKIVGPFEEQELMESIEKLIL